MATPIEHTELCYSRRWGYHGGRSCEICSSAKLVQRHRFGAPAPRVRPGEYFDVNGCWCRSCVCAFNTACFKDKLGGKVPDWFSQKNLVEATRFSARKKLHGRLTAINSKARKEKKTPGNKKPTAATVEQHAVADQLRADEWTASIISEENSASQLEMVRPGNAQGRGSSA